MERIKKIAAILLAVAMVFTMMPLTHSSFAYAEGSSLNCTVDGSELTWDAIEGADYYDLTWGGLNYCTTPADSNLSIYMKDVYSWMFTCVANHSIDDPENTDLMLIAYDADDNDIASCAVENDFNSLHDGHIKGVKYDDDCLYWDPYFDCSYEIYLNNICYSSQDDCEFSINHAIDKWISNGKLEKTGSYNIKIEAIYGEEVQAAWTDNYKYDSNAGTPNDDLGDLELNDEGCLSWQYVRGADYYRVTANGNYLYHGDDNSLSLYDYIDSAIASGDLEKADSYEIAVSAYSYNDEENPICSAKITLDYESQAIPPADDFTTLYVDENGNLRWNNINGADDYYVTVGSKRANLWGNPFDINFFIDKGIKDGLIEKSEYDTYEILVEAVKEEYNEETDDFDTTVIKSKTIEYEYHSDAEALKDYFEVDLDPEDNYLSWKEILNAEYYNYTINGYQSYDINDCGFYLFEEIDNLIRKGYIEPSEEYTVVINAVDGEGNPVCEPYTHTYQYSSETIPASDKFESVNFNEEEGFLQWNGIKGAISYHVTINGEYTIEFYDTDLGLNEYIDEAIGEHKLTKKDKYTIKLEAFDEEGNSLCDPYVLTYEYHSYAEPRLKEFIDLEIEDERDGYLCWNRILGADAYRYTIDGVSEITDSDDIYADEVIDRWIGEGKLSRTDNHKIFIEAIDEEYNEDTNETVEKVIAKSKTLDYFYSSIAPAPADTFESVTIDERNEGYITWNKIKGADYYKYTIDGYSMETGELYAWLDSEIRLLIKDGVISDKAEHDIILEAYKYKDPSQGMSENDIAMNVKWTGKYTYKMPVNLNLEIKNGMLDAKGEDGKVPAGAYTYEVYINGWGGGWFRTMPQNLYDIIDGLVETCQGFEKAEVYYVNVDIYDQNNKMIGSGETEFSYDSKAEYRPPETMKLTLENGVLKWNAVSGAETYTIGAGMAGDYSVSLEKDTLEFSGINNLVDKTIALGGEKTGTYRIIVWAENAMGRTVGQGYIDYKYDSKVEKAKRMNASVAADGTVTWDKVDGADHYEVGVYYEYTKSYNASPANINLVISEGINSKELTQRDYYNIAVRAYDKNGILLGKWFRKNYKYNSGYAHAHDFGPWEPVDENSHQRVCKGDSTHIESAEHTWDGGKVTKEATTETEGEMTYTCTACGFTRTEMIPKITEVAKISIARAKITNVKTKTYTGKKRTQKPVVKVGSKKLVKGTDYKLTYKSNVNVGLATMTISGIGKYTGTVKKTFKINPKGAVISKPKAAKKTIIVKWKAQKTKMKKTRITGYEVQASLKKNFKKLAKKATVKGYRKTSVKLTKLKSNKTYYVRVRTYMKVGKKTYRSAWSKVKTVKVK